LADSEPAKSATNSAITHGVGRNLIRIRILGLWPPPTLHGVGGR